MYLGNNERAPVEGRAGALPEYYQRGRDGGRGARDSPLCSGSRLAPAGITRLLNDDASDSPPTLAALIAAWRASGCPSEDVAAEGAQARHTRIAKVG
jgi:hypothetical protein